jgi:hypothetical protein
MEDPVFFRDADRAREGAREMPAYGVDCEPVRGMESAQAAGPRNESHAPLLFPWREAVEERPALP